MTDTKLKVDYIGIMETLESRQMILQGPPGTSKTYGAKKIIAEALELNNEISSENDKNLTEKEKINKILSCKLIKDEYDKSARWDMVQFHPSYGYEDFVRGIIVETKEDSSFDTESKEHVISHHIEYNTIDKTFGRICRLAKKNLDDKFFLLIDEINRADVATTLGELIYALENRGEEVTTPYKVKDRDGIESNKICVPKNLYIIGTMNTADKSVGNIDYAIRRRFLFFDLLPNRKTIEDYLMGENNETETWKSEVIMAFDAINYIVEKDLDPTYSPKDFKIGHTYFLVKSEDEFLKKMKYQVFPIIREYIADGILRPNLANQISELNNYWKTGEIGNEKTIIDDLNKKYSEWTNSKGVQQE